MGMGAGTPDVPLGTEGKIAALLLGGGLRLWLRLDSRHRSALKGGVGFGHDLQSN